MAQLEPKKLILPVTGLFVVLSIILSIGVMRGRTGIKDFFALRESADVLAKTVEDLEVENQSLKDEIMKIKKSKNYARKILRDKYHVLEEDERIIFLPD